MSKKIFLRKLKRELKYLNRENLKLALREYKDLDNYNLNPVEEAKKIYDRLRVEIPVKQKFLDSISYIINIFKSKDKNLIQNMIVFFLYLLLVIIIIKVPFIYTRDMVSNIFSSLQEDGAYVVWNLIIELLYTITSVFVLIYLINDKVKKLKNSSGA